MSKWYRTGKVNVVNGSDTVSGVAAYWATAADKPEAGDIWTDDEKIYEIVAVNSDSELLIEPPFKGATGNNVSYGIIKVISQNGMTRVAGQVSEVLSKLGERVTVSTTAPASNQGNDGDIWIVAV